MVLVCGPFFPFALSVIMRIKIGLVMMAQQIMARRSFVSIINECPFLNRSLESIEQISTAFRPFVFMTVLRFNQKHFEMYMRNLKALLEYRKEKPNMAFC